MDQKANNGLTPIHLACHEGYFEMVELLIENGKYKNIIVPTCNACIYKFD